MLWAPGRPSFSRPAPRTLAARGRPASAPSHRLLAEKRAQLRKVLGAGPGMQVETIVPLAAMVQAFVRIADKSLLGEDGLTFLILPGDEVHLAQEGEQGLVVSEWRGQVVGSPGVRHDPGRFTCTVPPPASRSSSVTTKPLNRWRSNRHEAASPATPPPTITTGTLRQASLAGCGGGSSRRRCPSTSSGPIRAQRAAVRIAGDSPRRPLPASREKLRAVHVASVRAFINPTSIQPRNSARAAGCRDG